MYNDQSYHTLHNIIGARRKSLYFEHLYFHKKKQMQMLFHLYKLFQSSIDLSSTQCLHDDDTNICDAGLN